MIVGAGVMGLGTAFHLAERGFDVTVLEKEDSVAKVSTLFYSRMHKWLNYKYLKITLIWNNVLIYDCSSQVASRSNGALLCPSMCASWADIKINKTVSDFYIYNVKYTNFVAILNMILFLVLYFQITNLC